MTKKEIMKKKMVDYLMKTSQHLFVDRKGNFHKVLLTKVNDEWICTKISFGDSKPKVNFYSLEVRDENNDLDILKERLFSSRGWDADKKRSIRNFKVMKELMFDVTNIIRKEYDGTRDSMKTIEDEVSKIVGDIKCKA